MEQSVIFERLYTILNVISSLFMICKVAKQNIVYWEFHKYLYKITRKEIIRSKKEELNGKQGKNIII